jgi:hypothetical protein
MKDCAAHKVRRRATAASSTGPPLLVLLLFVVFVMSYRSLRELDRTDSLDRIRHSAKARNQPAGQQATQPKKSPQLYVPVPSRSEGVLPNLVKAGDYIYYQDPLFPRWDAAPIVIESHKLVFFAIPKVGCTVWKMLFRRMMGYADWQSQDYSSFQPHNPGVNGLKYLYQYSLEEASEIMTSPEWTRAIMVRDPKLRFLSAFLDKAVSNNHTHIRHRCCPDESCIAEAQTIPGFLQLVQVCDDEHWHGQHARMEAKYWPYIDVVAHVETAAGDARDLLHRIGAWDEYGATGWGVDGDLAIFGSKGTAGAGEHATWSQWKVWQWYTPESERMVERFYQADYTNPLFAFDRDTCLTCKEKSS